MVGHEGNGVVIKLMHFLCPPRHVEWSSMSLTFKSLTFGEEDVEIYKHFGSIYCKKFVLKNHFVNAQQKYGLEIIYCPFLLYVLFHI